MKNLITQAELKEIIHYDPFSGEFFWLPSQANKFGRATQLRGGLVLARSIDSCGYYRIAIKCREYKAQRLAWFYVTGKWPTHQIDHINRIKTDNRFSNLREATHSQNSCNKVYKKKSLSGFRGVKAADKNGRKWMAHIKPNNRREHIGSFDTKEDAARAYDSAALRIFGEFAVLNYPLEK